MVRFIKRFFFQDINHALKKVMLYTKYNGFMIENMVVKNKYIRVTFSKNSTNIDDILFDRFNEMLTLNINNSLNTKKSEFNDEYSIDRSIPNLNIEFNIDSDEFSNNL